MIAKSQTRFLALNKTLQNGHFCYYYNTYSLFNHVIFFQLNFNLFFFDLAPLAKIRSLLGLE